MALRERNERIFQMRKEGKTLVEIAKMFDISRERVREIIVCLKYDLEERRRHRRDGIKLETKV